MPAHRFIGGEADETVCRHMNMSWGVRPGILEEKTNTDELIEHAIEVSKQLGYVREGDLVVVTAGVPLGRSGTTNLVKVETVK